MVPFWNWAVYNLFNHTQQLQMVVSGIVVVVVAYPYPCLSQGPWAERKEEPWLAEAQGLPKVAVP